MMRCMLAAAAALLGSFHLLHILFFRRKLYVFCVEHYNLMAVNFSFKLWFRAKVTCTRQKNSAVKCSRMHFFSEMCTSSSWHLSSHNKRKHVHPVSISILYPLAYTLKCWNYATWIKNFHSNVNHQMSKQQRTHAAGANGRKNIW